MVGTRPPTVYGSGMAERLAIDLGARGLVMLSGVARGVDSASHRGAIAARDKTIVVFGTGVDVIYPKENRRLAEQILALGGALISESRWAHWRRRKTPPPTTASSAACRWVCEWWKQPNTRALALARAAP